MVAWIREILLSFTTNNIYDKDVRASMKFTIKNHVQQHLRFAHQLVFVQIPVALLSRKLIWSHLAKTARIMTDKVKIPTELSNSSGVYSHVHRKRFSPFSQFSKGECSFVFFFGWMFL